MSSFQISMFMLGVLVTLGGVFLLSHRKMNQLKPKQKFRAWVHMVIFIQRLQKDSGVDYQWGGRTTIVLEEAKPEELKKFLTNSHHSDDQVLSIEGDGIDVNIEGDEIEISTSSTDLEEQQQQHYPSSTIVVADDPHDNESVDEYKNDAFRDDYQTVLKKKDYSSIALDECQV